ncbi:MAG: hypothetical protein SVZ03_16735 [Spirochaetota bacterium]|nr:hypothetical protein [Spirochaetota bacterium]
MFKLFKWIFYLSIAICCLLGFYFRAEHPHFFWQKIPVYDAVMGFVGCIIIVIVSKALGHNWLQKEEDYYDK